MPTTRFTFARRLRVRCGDIAQPCAGILYSLSTISHATDSSEASTARTALDNGSFKSKGHPDPMWHK
ncbi:hypothetical protein [Nocardia jiangxiensis]|uniref:Uncharacterized protein n=1 Tax=Nocardia jiangxiensis TaxID=282685 RepID=A0ABW6SFI0_9NOCA|nr:hypothetical protein [Nocardia jiangxiensis]